MATESYAFATVEDLMNHWRSLSADEANMAATLLDDAGLILRQYVSIDDADSHQRAALKMVSCNMVKRAMVASSSSAFGVDQTIATMGPFSQTMHYSNPSGDLYISAAEKRLLRIGGNQIGTVYPARVEDWYGSDA